MEASHSLCGMHSPLPLCGDLPLRCVVQLGMEDDDNQLDVMMAQVRYSSLSNHNLVTAAGSQWLKQSNKLCVYPLGVLWQRMA